jgi:hypothetical protein
MTIDAHEHNNFLSLTRPLIIHNIQTVVQTDHIMRKARDAVKR